MCFFLCNVVFVSILMMLLICWLLFILCVGTVAAHMIVFLLFFLQMLGCFLFRLVSYCYWYLYTVFLVLMLILLWCFMLFLYQLLLLISYCFCVVCSSFLFMMLLMVSYLYICCFLNIVSERIMLVFSVYIVFFVGTYYTSMARLNKLKQPT